MLISKHLMTSAAPLVTLAPVFRVMLFVSRVEPWVTQTIICACNTYYMFTANGIRERTVRSLCTHQRATKGLLETYGLLQT